MNTMRTHCFGQRFKRALFLALGLIFIWGCGEGPEQAERKEQPPTSAEQLEPHREQAPAPKPKPPAVGQETKNTYQWYCAQCHGTEGKGNGINAIHLTVPPRDHTKAEYLETRTDQQLFDAIKLGGLAVGRAPCMPSWGLTLDDEMIHSLARYVRELCECEAS